MFLQVLSSQQTGADVRLAQKHLSEIQTTYNGTVERLQVWTDIVSAKVCFLSEIVYPRFVYNISYTCLEYILCLSIVCLRLVYNISYTCRVVSSGVRRMGVILFDLVILVGYDSRRNLFTVRGTATDVCLCRMFITARVGLQ